MNFENCYFLIPARKGSKGLRFKNRKLFDNTAKTIPVELANKVYVSTDDFVIENKAKEYGFNLVSRPADLANDTASLKDVLLHFVDERNIKPAKTIIFLFLTYPERTWEDIVKIYDFFKSKRANSLVCAEKVIDHPYLCLYELEDSRGKMMIEHDLYRRQDYPDCFRATMFVGCFKSDIIKNLSDLLIEEETIFYKMDINKIDVDYAEDYNEFIST